MADAAGLLDALFQDWHSIGAVTGSRILVVSTTAPNPSTKITLEPIRSIESELRAIPPGIPGEIAERARQPQDEQVWKDAMTRNAPQLIEWLGLGERLLPCIIILVPREQGVILLPRPRHSLFHILQTIVKADQKASDVTVTQIAKAMRQLGYSESSMQELDYSESSDKDKLYSALKEPWTGWRVNLLYPSNEDDCYAFIMS